MTILTIVIVLAVAAVICYLSWKYLPGNWKLVPIGLIILALVVWFFSLTGIAGGLNTRVR